MRAPHGLATVIVEGREILDRDTITCGHCQRIVLVKPGTGSTVYLLARAGTWREEPGAFCRVCMSPICLPCCDRGGCTPWERQLEVSEARDRLRRQALEQFA